MTHTALATLLLATVTAAACSKPTAATPPEQAAPLAVTTTAAALQDRPQTFETGGIVRARLTAIIASRVMAPITAVHVVAGDRVRRGAPLVDLDARELRANQERGMAAVTAAEQAALAADADHAAAQAALTLATATHQRIAELAARKSATAQELDQATAALSGAQAQLLGATARQAAATAGRDAASAGRAVADTTLSYTRLTAPFDAVVSQRAIDPGTMATPGATLLVLEDPSRFRVEATLDESRAAQVELGSVVEVALGSTGSQVAAGQATGATSERDAPAWMPARVTEVSRLDPASHAFLVKIDLPQGAAVRSGAFARVRITGPSRTMLTIPGNALVRRGQLAFVFAIDSGRIARLRAVFPGAVYGDDVEVLSGLSDGDLLVAQPPAALTDGRPVQPATAASTQDRPPTSGVAR